MLRVNDTLTGKGERKLLKWLVERMPRWVTSDMLTGLGVLGAAISLAGYILSELSIYYLWLACAGVAINWFGDSLDGTLARHLKAERPKYGFFLDHMTDAFAMAMIALGIGLTPYTNLTCAMAVLLAYYLMVIMSMVTAQATGVFQISYNELGPTEIRLFIILCTVSAILFPVPMLDWGSASLSIYDAIMAVIAVLLTLMCVSHTIKTARALAIQDPPRR